MKTERWERWALGVAMLIGAVLMLRPVLGDPLHLAVGSLDSEAPRHLWGLWGAATGLWERGPLVSHLDVDFPSGYTRHLMDPINLVFFLPGYWFGGGGSTGATIGYNLVHLVWPMAGAWGGWMLSGLVLADHPLADQRRHHIATRQPGIAPAHTQELRR